MVSFLRFCALLWFGAWLGLVPARAQPHSFRDPSRLVQYLDSLSKLERDTNRTVIYFASLYRITTENILRLKNEGKFQNPLRIDSMICEFGTRFARAVEQNQEAPLPWHRAFYLSRPKSEMQCLLLAINAHINYDLPETLLQFSAFRPDKSNDEDYLLIDQVYEDLSKQIFANLLVASELRESEKKLLNRYLNKSIRTGKKWRSDILTWIKKKPGRVYRKKNQRSKRVSFWLTHPIGNARKLHRIMRRIEKKSAQENVQIWFQSTK